MKEQLEAARAPASQIGRCSDTAEGIDCVTTSADFSELFHHAVKLFLQFAVSTAAGTRRRRAKLDHAFHVVCPHNAMTTDAGTLHAVTIRSRAAATGADSKGSASLMTEPITAPHALTEVLGDHLQSSR